MLLYEEDKLYGHLDHQREIVSPEGRFLYYYLS